LTKESSGAHLSKSHTELGFNQYLSKVVKTFINLYHINLYGCYKNG